MKNNNLLFIFIRIDCIVFFQVEYASYKNMEGFTTKHVEKIYMKSIKMISNIVMFNLENFQMI